LILDTNALSAIADCEPAALTALVPYGRFAIPVVVLGEYRAGIMESRGRTEYEAWLLEMIASSTILNVDDETTYHYAAINLQLKRSGRPIPTNDIWIAALCRQYSSPVVSRDRHFDFVQGLKRIAW
jgi:tRNA(fMet)-specific endonuclease VapC